MGTIVKAYPIKDASIANHTTNPGVNYANGASMLHAMGAWDAGQPDYSYYTNGYYSYQGRILMQFPVVQLPPGAVVIKATLKMGLIAAGKSLANPSNQKHYKENTVPTIDVHRMIDDWEEGNFNGNTNYYYYSTYPIWQMRAPNKYWTYNNKTGGYGGGIQETPSATMSVPYMNHEAAFDITDLYKGWVNGIYPNNGLMVKYRNDEVPQGAFYLYTKETGTNKEMLGVPYLEVEYNEPPEPPRGLQPNNLGTISPRWGPVRMDWDFIDLENEWAEGKIDLVFLLDGSGSFADDKTYFLRDLRAYLDRLDAANSDYRLMLIDHRSPQKLTKYGWYDNRYLFEKTVEEFKPGGGNYSPTWMAFLDEENGAKSLQYRPDAEVHLIFMCDESMQGTVNNQIKNVTDWAISQKYTIWTIIHGCYLWPYQPFSVPTGGENIDLHIEWNKRMPVPKPIPKVGNIEAGDTQSKAEVTIYKVENNGTRTVFHNVTVNGSTTHVDLDPEVVPFVNKQVYEWRVKVYDSSGLSATSARAIFTYRDDDGSYNTEIPWGELPKPGDIVKRSDIFQFKEELLQLIPLYPNMKPSMAKKLFTGDIVPSREDARLLKEILTEMMTSTVLKVTEIWTRDFVDDDLLDPDDIEYIRTIISILKNQGPSTPPKMTATVVENYMTAPVSLTANNGGMYSSSINLTWAPPRIEPGGFVIKTQPSPSRNLLFYRVHYNFRRNILMRNKAGGTVPKSELFHTYFQYTPQMFEDGGLSTTGNAREGEIFIAKDGETTFDEIYVRAVDTEGHYSPYSYVDIQKNNMATSPGTQVQYYKVEYQVGDIDAIQSDPQGMWHLADTYLTSNSTSIAIKATGTVWFRIQAVTHYGYKTDYTYTTTPIKLLL